MISFDSIGSLGRIGNQMFQYASTIGIALKNNYECEFNFQHPKCYIHQIFDLSKLSKSKSILPKQILKEHSLAFDPKIYQCKDDTLLRGYLQNIIYFDDYRDYIKKEFKFKSKIKDTVNNKLPNTNYIAVHIRRKDYLKHKNIYFQLDLTWYRNAFKLFDNNNFLIFSDDIKWCKNNFNESNIMFSEFTKSEEDLYAMTLGKGLIIANSTFSWWAAYLSNNIPIVYPKNWMKTRDFTKNVCLPEWIGL
jgi:hypothetical protein